MKNLILVISQVRAWMENPIYLGDGFFITFWDVCVFGVVGGCAMKIIADILNPDQKECERVEGLTTEILATPTDSDYVENNYSFNDMYLLVFAFVLFVIALLVKFTVRKMYINLLGGRKGE